MSRDKEFEDYLEGKSGLSNLYADVPETRTPDHLDAAILAEAHRAVGARPGGRRWRTWGVPLSMAATLFVAVIVGLQWFHLPRETLSQQAPLKESAGVERLTPEKPAASPEAQPAELPALERHEQRVQQAPKAEPVMPEKQRARSPEAPVADQALPASPQQQAAPPAEATMSNQAPPAPLKLEAVPEAAGRAESKRSARRKAAQEQPADKKDSMDSAGAVPPPPVLGGAASAPSPQATGKDDANAPEKWLARIQELKRQGKLDEARKEYAAFRKHYPDYPVPKGAEIK
jgi:hypothetical protein